MHRARAGARVERALSGKNQVITRMSPAAHPVLPHIPLDICTPLYAKVFEVIMQSLAANGEPQINYSHLPLQI